MLASIQSFDTVVSLFIQNALRSQTLNAVMLFLTTLGDKGVIWLLTAVLLFVFPKTRKAALGLVAVVGCCWVCNTLLKHLVGRPRPYLTVEGLCALVRDSGASFPSGHACSSFAAAYYLARTFPKKGGPWAFLPAAVIAFSRVYAGVHYLSDVLVGTVEGLVVGILVTWLYRLLTGRLFSRRGKHEKAEGKLLGRG